MKLKTKKLKARIIAARAEIAELRVLRTELEKERTEFIEQARARLREEEQRAYGGHAEKLKTDIAERRALHTEARLKQEEPRTYGGHQTWRSK